MVVKPKLVHYTFLSDFSCLIIIVKSSHVLWHPVNLQVCSLNRAQFKVHMTRNFLLAIWKSFQSDEEWRLFYCNSILVCRVIKDVGLCKLDDL